MFAKYCICLIDGKEFDIKTFRNPDKFPEDLEACKERACWLREQQEKSVMPIIVQQIVE